MNNSKKKPVVTVLPIKETLSFLENHALTIKIKIDTIRPETNGVRFKSPKRGIDRRAEMDAC